MKKYSKFERIYGYNYSFIIEKGPFVEWIAATGGKLTLYLCKQRALLVLISKKDSTLCKWLPEIMAVPLKCIAACAPLKLQYALSRNICQIHCIYTIHGCNCCSEISTVSIKEWITAANFVK